jgi:uncharacterized protein YqgC (DUF456 family)
VAYLLLALAQLLGLLLIPFGLPGLWLQVAALAGYGWWTDFTRVSTIPIVIVASLALLAEIAEFLLGGRYARKYGGGRRAGYGAVLGGIVGAVVGLPVPLPGSVFGALIGSFAGALLLELTTGRGTEAAARAGWGALIGRVVATAMKGAVGVVIAVFTLFVALR